MKKALILILIGFFFVSTAHASWTDDWCINGIPVKSFKETTAKEKTQLGLGIGLSFLTHFGMHALYFWSQDISWGLDGLSERYNENGLSASQQRWCGRSGPFGQVVVGIALELSPWKDSWVVTGYHIGTVVEILPYQLTGYEDFDTIDINGGNGNLEHATYSVIALWLAGPYQLPNQSMKTDSQFP